MADHPDTPPEVSAFERQFTDAFMRQLVTEGLVVFPPNGGPIGPLKFYDFSDKEERDHG